jgi:hypothetical protein
VSQLPGVTKAVHGIAIERQQGFNSYYVNADQTESEPVKLGDISCKVKRIGQLFEILGEWKKASISQRHQFDSIFKDSLPTPVFLIRPAALEVYETSSGGSNNVHSLGSESAILRARGAEEPRWTKWLDENLFNPGAQPLSKESLSKLGVTCYGADGSVLPTTPIFKFNGIESLGKAAVGITP